MAQVDLMNLDRFKLRLDKAKAEGKDRFEFDGQEVLVTYAVYLVEYLEGERARIKRAKGGM